MPEPTPRGFARFAAPEASEPVRVFTAGRSSLRLHHGVRHLRLDEVDDYHCGRAAGELLLASGDALVRLLRLAPVRWLTWLASRVIRRHLEPVRVTPQAQDELRGLADGSGIALHTLVYLNFVFDVLKHYGIHCSTLVYFQQGSVLVGRNTDLMPALAALALRLIRPLVVEVSLPGRARFTQVSGPCCVGVLNGFNEHGITVHSHQVIHVAEAPQGPRLASSLLMRQLLEGAHDLASATRIARANPTARSLNVVVGSAREQRGIVLEVHPDRVHVLEQEGALACTTHFESASMRPWHDGPIEASQDRLASLRALIAEHPAPDLAELMTMLKDQRHGLAHDVSARSVSNLGTFQSFVFDLGRGVVVVSNGRRRPVSCSGVPVVVQLGTASIAPPPAALPEAAQPVSPAAGLA